MSPTLFAIDDIQIASLPVFIGLGYALFIILTWYYFHNRLKVNLGFDIVFLSMILSPLVARLVYIVLNWSDFISRGWSILPVSENIEGIKYFYTLPWIAFAVWDSKMIFQVIPIATFFAIFIMVREKKKAKEYFFYAWKAFIPAYMFFIVGFLLAGTYKGIDISVPLKVRYAGDSEDKFVIQILDLVVLALIYIFYLDSDSKIVKNLKKYSFAIFPCFWSIYQVLSIFLYEGFSKSLWLFGSLQIVWLIFLIILLVWIGGFIDKVKKKQKKANLNFRKPMKFRSKEKSENDYSVSFARYRKNIGTNLSAKERLIQTSNRIKRGIK